MKKKFYYRTSLGSIFLQMICLFMIGCSIYGCIEATSKLATNTIPQDKQGITIFITILFYLGVLLGIYLESTFYFGLIILEPTRIVNSGDNRLGLEKIQYQSSIDYLDIKEIDIRPLCQNSIGRKALLLRPIPYLCIKGKGKEIVKLSLGFMSLRVTKKLLIDLSKKCSALGNNITFDIDKLISDFKKALFAVKEKDY